MRNTPPAFPIRFRRLAWAAFAAAALAFSMTGMTACEPVEIDPVGTDTTDTAATGTATLRITNNISEDPDSLVFYLFPGNATEISTATKTRVVGGVAVNGTGVFKVPAGTWKLGYENRSRALEPMRDQDTQEWVKSIFAKGGDYSLILTNEAQFIKWNPTFPTDPEIR